MADDANMMEQALISEEMGPMGAPSTVPLTITSSGGSTTQAEPAPGQARALQDAQEARALQAQDTREQGEAEAEELRAKAVGADDVATQNMLNLVETQDAIDRNKAAVSAAQAAAEQSHREAEEAASKLKGYDFWANKSTWDRLSAKIAVGLGGIGAAYLGQPNEVLADINRTIDRDFDVQKAYVTSKEHAAELRRKGVADIQAQLEKELAALKVKQGQAIEATSKRAEAMLIRAGVPVQQAKTNVAVLGLQATAAEKKADALKDFEVHHTNQGSRTVAQHIVPGGAPAIARDENGQPIGTLPSARQLPAFETRDADYKRAQEQLEALAKDIKDHGERVVLPSSIKRRQRLKENADIAVATVSPLGKTDEAMKKESASIGQSGTGSVKSFLVGANEEAVKSKLEELKVQRERYRKETLTPLAPAGATPAASQVVTPPPPAPAKLTDIQVAQAMEWLRKNPTDPRAPARRAKLRELMGAR